MILAAVNWSICRPCLRKAGRRRPFIAHAGALQRLHPRARAVAVGWRRWLEMWAERGLCRRLLKSPDLCPLVLELPGTHPTSTHQGQGEDLLRDLLSAPCWPASLVAKAVCSCLCALARPTEKGLTSAVSTRASALATSLALCGYMQQAPDGGQRIGGCLMSWRKLLRRRDFLGNAKDPSAPTLPGPLLFRLIILGLPNILNAVVVFRSLAEIPVG